MGNCLASLFGRPKRPRSYFTGRYKDYNVGVEFDNLIEDENEEQNERDLVNKSEKEHLINKQFSKLVDDQRRVDAEIDAELHQEEERNRLEEEAYIAAKKEAARIAKQAKLMEEQKRKKPLSNGSLKSWAGDNGDWSMANEEEEEDFDSFLQTVTARSENVRASVASFTQTNQHSPQLHHAPQPDPAIFSSEFNGQGINGFPRNIPDQSHSSTNHGPFQDSTSTDLFSSQKTDLEWEADFVSTEKKVVLTTPEDGSGDAGSTPHSNEQIDSGGDETPLAMRETKNSFSITDEEDDQILDLEPESSEQFSAKQTDTEVLDAGTKNTARIEAEAFDIDIDKFLEELDAEL